MKSARGYDLLPAGLSPAALPDHSTNSIRLPLQGLTGEGWFDLAIAAVAAICVAYWILTFIGHGLFDYMGGLSRLLLRLGYSVAEISSSTSIAFVRGLQPAHQWLDLFMFFLNLILVGRAAYRVRKPTGSMDHPPEAVD